MKKTLYLLAFPIFILSLLFYACNKDEVLPPQQKIYQLIMKEYPAMTPAAGARVRLYDCGSSVWGCQLNEIGDFTSKTNGFVKTTTNFTRPYSRAQEGGGFIPTVMQNDTLPIPECYVAKPGWVRLNIRNVPPTNASDHCDLNLIQEDPLKLPRNSDALWGWNRLYYFVESYKGGSINESSLYRLIAGIPAKLDVYLWSGTTIDSTLQFMVPTNDTLIVNFDY